MECTKCQGPTKVIDSRQTKTNKRRRRECVKCANRFTTTESVVILKKETDWFGRPLKR